MRELPITLGVTCLAFSLAACSKALVTEADEQAILETYKAWVEATNAKDIEKWSTFLAINPYFHPADSSPLTNTEKIISYYERSFADPMFSLDCRQEHVDVSASGEMAWSRGECTAAFTGADGNEASGTSSWLKVWIKQSDGSWRCRVNIWRNIDPL
jgi:ketosteroid isomerase-like protein